MKAFRFSLQRVLELRATQAKSAEAALQGLLGQREAKRLEQQGRRDALAQAYARQHGLAELRGMDLVALGEFSRQTERECRELDLAIEADGKRIAEQSAIVVQARSRVRLLEKLRERRQEEWKRESDRELDELAGEFTNAQWLRLRRADADRSVSGHQGAVSAKQFVSGL